MQVHLRRLFLAASVSVAATVLPCLSAHALPRLGSVEDLSQSTGPDRIVILDHADPRIRYLAYDQIHVGKDPETGKTAFSFQYTDTGGILSALVSAGYSPDALALRERLTAQG